MDANIPAIQYLSPPLRKKLHKVVSGIQLLRINKLRMVRRGCQFELLVFACGTVLMIPQFSFSCCSLYINFLPSLFFLAICVFFSLPCQNCAGSQVVRKEIMNEASLAFFLVLYQRYFLLGLEILLTFLLPYPIFLLHLYSQCCV